MSTLKYENPERLREIIKSGQERAQLMRERADALTSNADALRQEAERLAAEAAELRMQAHNSLQRVTWAKVYLARKELP